MSAKQSAIDLKHLHQYTCGDVQMEREIYSLFREQVRVWLKLLIADGDTEGWAAAAHSLKGSARGIGAHQLAAACEAAEAVIRAGTPARSVAAAQVREQVNAVIHFIDKREYKLQIQDLRK
ncbi:MAG: Hpt domain-containing protein [Robiginitomaculum sp.]|nr:Hpt domain-containing protein [Robiginitomaculum sp.]